jgi:hypothetical protein
LEGAVPDETLSETIKRIEAFWEENRKAQRRLVSAWLGHSGAESGRCSGEPSVVLCPAEGSSCRVRSCLKLGACRRVCWYDAKPWAG